ncbi:oligomeric, coiled-coil, peripheral membrane protein [Elasticomyces elasticus]|nr:oligomeric, coiled-coil, peripheral membrane protein [Elasticomyces elasticus]
MLQIYIAHTGQRLEADPGALKSLDDLRALITKATQILAKHQIFLTAKGRQVRPQALLTEVRRGNLKCTESCNSLTKQSELFVFHSGFLALPSANTRPPTLPHVTVPAEYVASAPPDTLQDEKDLQSWQNLFKARRKWAFDTADQCAAISQDARANIEERLIIERGLGIAVTSLQGHVRSVQQKYAEVQAWHDEELKAQELQVDSWDASLAALEGIPARPEFGRFLQSQNVSSRRESKASAGTYLSTFVSSQDVRKAASTARAVTAALSERVVDLQSIMDSAVGETEELTAATDQMQTQSTAEGSEEPGKLMEEIEIHAQKISRDYEHVLTQQSVAQISKMALLHTRNYLPTLRDYATEMSDLVRRSAEQRNSTADLAMQRMQTLASIESSIQQAYTVLKALEETDLDDEGALEKLRLASRLPHVYGLLLVEAVRRREWAEKMKKDSATLAEEMATYQEEEERRRRNWVKTVDDIVKVDTVHAKPLGIELNLQSEQASWPLVTRQELGEYVDALKGLDMADQIIQDLTLAIRDLDKPTKKQLKTAKAFKNGSMHEAVFPSSSLMLRGDDETKTLRENHASMERELKASKSRVRKLEDLLHRQSYSKISTGDLFQPQSGMMRNQITSALPTMPTPRTSDELSRQGSLKGMRQNSGQATEEKQLAKRIVTLEAELLEVKDRSSKRENDLIARRRTDEEQLRQIAEANSTKKDLMENMEAQQREFATERKNLEEELAAARAKLEELEDEIDRLLGSRDNEKSGSDNKVKALEAELSRTQDELRQEKEKAADAVCHVHEAQAAKEKLQTELDQLRAASVDRIALQNEQVGILQGAFTHLSPETSVPEDYAGLSRALEDLARRSASHVRDLAQAVALAKSENESLRDTEVEHLHSLTQSQAKTEELEQEISRSREQASEARVDRDKLSCLLDAVHEQLRLLKSKFAEGETGSEALRRRVADEEAKAKRLSEQLAEARSHINSLDVELMRLQSRGKSLQAAAETAAERLQQRSSRAKETSQRLHTQNARFLRLLESLGFAVTYKDNNMIVERASRINASTILPDAPVFSRTVSLSSPPPTRKSSGAEESINDLSFLRWSDAADSASEAAAFAGFLAQVDRFSSDIFSDAITKRLRDFEYTARKWAKEAKVYKEKSHRYQAEAHDKIALKSFKEGDLALFLPTKLMKGAWAAFNVNAPHHFLREREGMGLGRREWLVARISKIEEKVVDLSKSIERNKDGESDGRSIGEVSEGALSFDDNDNPFDLSDGLRWYLLDAAEEKVGAPSTPGLGKSTVASAIVDARGSIRVKKAAGGVDASKTLNQSLDSRRSSSNSKKGLLFAANGAPAAVTAEAASADGAGSGRTGSESQASTKVAPAPPGGHGLGIAKDTDTDTAQPNNDEAERSRRQSNSDAAHVFASPAKSLVHQRSTSPSRSIRSLARHLEPAAASPKKVPERAKQGIWESLWSVDYEIGGGGGGNGGGKDK